MSDQNQNDRRPPNVPAPRGFAAMDPEMQRRIASKGGQSVPADKRSFSQDPALASAAGRKGGTSSSRIKQADVS